MPTKITIRVQPKASRRDVTLQDDVTLRVRVTSPPEGGKANDDVCEVLAKALGVPKRDVRIASGHRSRAKVVEIDLDEVLVQQRSVALPRSTTTLGG